MGRGRVRDGSILRLVLIQNSACRRAVFGILASACSVTRRLRRSTPCGSRPTDQDAETAPGNAPPWDDIMYRAPENRGTNPHLRSRKHTGYGIVLRAAVDTPQELSVHLQQIDSGPNYRWDGQPRVGAACSISLPRARLTASNASEDVGDRRDQDTDFCTTFGVYKDQHFRSIGQNVLSRPFYNLGCGQFARLCRGRALKRIRLRNTSAAVCCWRATTILCFTTPCSTSPSCIGSRGLCAAAANSEHSTGARSRSFSKRNAAHGNQTDASTGVWFDGVGDSMAV